MRSANRRPFCGTGLGAKHDSIRADHQNSGDLAPHGRTHDSGTTRRHHAAVHDTVNAYLNGKIDQWYYQTSGKGVVFIVNASTPEEAKAILENFPLGQAGLMRFDYIPLGPLNPLRILNDMVR